MVAARRRKPAALPSPVVLLADLRCVACDTADIGAISPGLDPVVGPAGVVLARGRDPVACCLRCATAIGWPWRSKPAEGGAAR